MYLEEEWTIYENKCYIGNSVWICLDWYRTCAETDRCSERRASKFVIH